MRQNELLRVPGENRARARDRPLGEGAFGNIMNLIAPCSTKLLTMQVAQTSLLVIYTVHCIYMYREKPLTEAIINHQGKVI